MDNANKELSFQYSLRQEYDGGEQAVLRVWSAIDDCGNEAILSQTLSCPGIAVKAKATLQGAMFNNARDGLMRDGLRVEGFLPMKEPYTELEGFQHHGLSGFERIEASLLAIEGNDAIIDWIFVELRAADKPQQVIATRSALLQRDGDIVDLNGDEAVVFLNVPQNDYFVSINHRNHISMTSVIPHTFTAERIPEIDFRQAREVHGSTSAGFQLENGMIALWAGDLNGDEKVIYQGPDNDVFNIFSYVIEDETNIDFLINFISEGYTKDDFNMDGAVIYQGPGNDRSILLFNTVLSHPLNENLLPNFIVERP